MKLKVAGLLHPVKTDATIAAPNRHAAFYRAFEGRAGLTARGWAA